MKKWPVELNIIWKTSLQMLFVPYLNILENALMAITFQRENVVTNNNFIIIKSADFTHSRGYVFDDCIFTLRTVSNIILCSLCLPSIISTNTVFSRKKLSVWILNTLHMKNTSAPFVLIIALCNTVVQLWLVVQSRPFVWKWYLCLLKWKVVRITLVTTR